MSVYNAKNGYGLQILGYDIQYEDCIIYRETREKIIELADKLVSKSCADGLIEQLNTMQSEAGNNPMFENKYEIPTYFINLILVKYGYKLLGD